MPTETGAWAVAMHRNEETGRFAHARGVPRPSIAFDAPILIMVRRCRIGEESAEAAVAAELCW